jgi:hypothetical protein
MITELKKTDLDFSICKLKNTENIKQINFTRGFMFLAVTPDEISLVCESGYVPADVTECESGWRALKIDGVLDFSMIGVIAKISGILAESNISIFVVSTYNTDYILLKAVSFDKGVGALIQNGYVIK